MDGKRRLGDLLVEAGMLTPEQLEKALNEQKRSGERLGKVLTRLGYVSEKDILEVLEFQLGIPKVVVEDYQLEPEVVRLIPERLARRHMAIPVRRDGNRLLVAMADPLNLTALDDLRLATGFEIIPAIASEREIETALSRFWQSFLENQAMAGFEETAADTSAAAWDSFDLDEAAETGIEGAPAVQLVNRLIAQAVRARASDIHIEPQEGSVLVRFRVDGLLREVLRLPPGVLSSLTSRIKIMGGMDIAEKRLPQDGRFQITLERRSIDLRVSTMPTVYGEKVVLRILDKKTMLLTLDKLGFSPATKEQYESLIRSTYGMILITGPTGSGKTTTLYATLNALSSPEKNIITIEDPVEYLLPGINQVQVNPKVGLDFAAGLRAILRQDPDIIMVGEIRDRETADIAVRAATTGHLVFSTLHTNDAAGAVTRLLDMGVEPFLVNSSLIGVVAQRLVRLICPQCREPYEPAPGDAAYAFLGENIDKKFYRGRGCRQCNYTGYQGRTAIQEILVMTDEIRSLVAAKAPVTEIKKAAVAGGMVTLREDGLLKAGQGLTTVEEVIRVSMGEF
ncbi:GspE/PulE family protein [Thermosediminibacter oceani]|uniref:Type II secretion system protein E (GspE) n=1 Tax=Thermosediminibacter oceani (strain ATCC BAA-1034 / DSM 16646 / JW/IW-1228P) TaxID=555079 RepID=D9RZA5_THEOJ|nr:GspE/PulE family protein [Thermosediminibacter oceani]ADL08659.1 type II secretion system protein E (GspE) [Thermosediminibacter oceani DSM 16646]